MSDFFRASELLQKGIAAAKAGRKEEARQILLQVTELDERNEQAWLWLSGMVDSPEERRVCLENVLAINPNNTHAQAGMQWLRQNEPVSPTPASSQERCPHCGTEVPASGSTCPHCEQPLIVACPGCGRYVDVEKQVCPDCGQALGDFRDGAAYYLALARAYLGARRLDLTLQAVARVEAADSDDPQVLESIATLYEKTGSIDRAITAYEQGIAKAPDHAAFYTGLAGIYRERSQLDKARALYEKAEQLSSDDPSVLFEMARLSFEQDGPTPQVLKSLQQVVQKQPMNAQAFLLMGDAYLAQDRSKQARQQYEHACQLTSPSSQIGQEARRKLAELESPDLYTDAAGWTDGRRRISPELRRRPGCITVYALLTGLGAVFSILTVLGLGLLLIGNRQGIEQTLRAQGAYLSVDLSSIMALAGIYFAFILGVSVINLALAIGLWYMKNWARIIVIVLQVLGMLGNLCQAGASILSLRQFSAAYGIDSYPPVLLIAMFIGFLVQAYFIFWFVANRELFD